MRTVGTILYWLAVLLVSLGVLVGLVLFFESRDPTEVEGAKLQLDVSPIA